MSDRYAIDMLPRQEEFASENLLGCGHGTDCSSMPPISTNFNLRCFEPETSEICAASRYPDLLQDVKLTPRVKATQVAQVHVTEPMEAPAMPGSMAEAFAWLLQALLSQLPREVAAHSCHQ
eukprot:s1774_g7.t1